MAVAVIRDGKLVHSKGYGLADIDTGIAIRPDTPFYLASVSKQITAMAVMILVERGKLSYDTRLVDYFSEAPVHWRTITIDHLLTHRSGIPDWFRLMGPRDRSGFTNDDVFDLLLQNAALEFTPGEQFKYSNSGYVLLAMLIESVSGQPFHVFVKENIFDPLGMTDSLVYDQTRPDVPGRARGYRHTNDGFVLDDYDLLTTGAGGMFSTAEDLFKWDQALYTDDLVGHATIERAFTGTPHYGYGWFIDEYEGMKRLSHGGGLAGFRTYIVRIPDAKFSVIVLSNGSFKGLDGLIDEIAYLYLSKGG